MAKKKQNIVITDKELTPTIIGKLDTKEKSPILLIFLFLIFIAVAIFLPDITNYVNSLLKGESITPVTPNVPVNEEEDPKNDVEEITYYDYSEELIITYDLFSMSNIVVNDNIISFNLNNISNKEINLENSKYFLELYSSDTTLLQRIKISYGTLAINKSQSYSYELDENTKANFAKLLVIDKTEKDYPEVTLAKNEEGYGVLTCTQGYETITYTFGDNLLMSINDLINYPISNDITYTQNLQKYQMLSATYNNYEGISSTIVPLDTGFTFTTLIDLQKAEISTLENNNYYANRTLAKTVKFETESNGFSCN